MTGETDARNSSWPGELYLQLLPALISVLTTANGGGLLQH